MRLMVLILCILSFAEVSYSDYRLQEYIRKLFSKAKVDCTQDSCSDSVAMLAIYSPGVGPSQCTASVLTPNTLITAAHCVDSFQDGMLSEGKIMALFPATNRFMEEKIKIISVVKQEFDPTSEVGVDWAVIQLEMPTSRPPLPKVDKVLPEGTKLKVLAFNPVPDPDRIRGVYLEKPCTLNQKALYGDILKNNYMDTIQLYATDCDELVKGNSGGPIVTEDGKLVGVLSRANAPEGFSEDKRTDQEKEEDFWAGFSGDGKAKKRHKGGYMAIISNVRCMAFEYGAMVWQKESSNCKRIVIVDEPGDIPESP